MKVFYDHLVIREEITEELDRYELTIDEREEIVRLVDETLHHHVLDVILTHLPKEKHQKFLAEFHKAPHDPKLLEDLKNDFSDIEEKISDEAKRIKKELLAEIKRTAKK